MAKVLFVSLYDRNAYGMRILSAQLKRHGHGCDIVFLKRYDTRRNYRVAVEPGEYPWIGINRSGKPFKYASSTPISATELELLRETVSKIQPDVIGLTVNTPLRVQNSRVTRFLRQHFRIPIVWGGYDPTVNPLDCLNLCDYACVGEGDQVILEIAQRLDEKKSLADVPNLAMLHNGVPRFNPKARLETNIDRYPWRDDTPEGKYFIDDNRLETNYAIVNDRPAGTYQAMSARGCPYRCSYCCEATLKEVYAGDPFLRRRSPADFVGELYRAKQQFHVTEFAFEDEIFAMNLKWLQEFAPLYRERIGAPFTAYIYPCRSIEGILVLLKGIGLKECCLALESGSERINRLVFDRVYDRDLFLKTARLCKDLSIDFYTDIITYCAYEEEADLRKTLDVVLDMGGGFDLCINKLFVLPGTRLAQQMEADGLTVGPTPKDLIFDYYCRLFWIASFSAHSRTVIRWLDGIGLLRRHPKLINPELVRSLLLLFSAYGTARSRRFWSALLHRFQRTPAHRPATPACR